MHAEEKKLGDYLAQHVFIRQSLTSLNECLAS